MTSLLKASCNRLARRKGLFALLCLALSTTVAADDLSQRKRQAGHPATSVERLWTLSDDPSREVREALGRNRRVPASLLEKLAADPDMHVRIAVATNLETTEAMHMRLARDREPAVRSVVARFEYVPIPVLMLLADDPSAEIRLEVARSLNADERVLRKAMHDSDPHVRQVAEQALQRLKAD